MVTTSVYRVRAPASTRATMRSTRLQLCAPSRLFEASTLPFSARRDSRRFGLEGQDMRSHVEVGAAEMKSRPLARRVDRLRRATAVATRGFRWAWLRGAHRRRSRPDLLAAGPSGGTRRR